MSGGVDSAVAAARAVDAGHDVVGVHLALSRKPRHAARRAAAAAARSRTRWTPGAPPTRSASRSTCGTSRERFRDDVVEDFIAEYSAGRTPNPCMRCNEHIKFAALLEKAPRPRVRRRRTGHYAIHPRRMPTATASCTAPPTGRRTSPTCSACSPAEQLAHAMFPLGATPSKAEVRAEAAARGFTRRAEARQPRHLLHPRRRHPRLARRPGRRRDRRHRRPRRRPARLARGRARVHRRPAQGPRPRHPGGRRQAAVRARGAPVEQHGRRRPEGGARDRRDRRLALHLGRRSARPTTPFDCDVQIRAHADPVPAPRASTASRRARHPPPTPRSTASPPARPPCSTSAPACSASVTIDRTVSADRIPA